MNSLKVGSELPWNPISNALQQSFQQFRSFKECSMYNSGISKNTYALLLYCMSPNKSWRWPHIEEGFHSESEISYTTGNDKHYKQNHVPVHYKYASRSVQVNLGLLDIGIIQTETCVYVCMHVCACVCTQVCMANVCMHACWLHADWETRRRGVMWCVWCAHVCM